MGSCFSTCVHLLTCGVFLPRRFLSRSADGAGYEPLLPPPLESGSWLGARCEGGASSSSAVHGSGPSVHGTADRPPPPGSRASSSQQRAGSAWGPIPGPQRPPDPPGAGPWPSPPLTPPRLPPPRRPAHWRSQPDGVLGRGTASLESHYELGALLGAGAYGTVRIGVHRETQSSWAIKTARKSALTRPGDVEALRREVCTLELLSSHPHVTSLAGTYEDADSVHLVLELCRGGGLLDWLARREVPGEALIARLAEQVLAVLEHSHTLGVMHRDIKPENILLDGPDDDAQVRVADYGLSALCPRAAGPLTAVVGSAYYVAPEVLRRSYGPPADVWSLGCTLHLLFSGRAPFQGDSQAEVFDAILNQSLTFRGRLWRARSRACRHAVQLMLVKDPRARPSAAQLRKHPWFAQARRRAGRSASPLASLVQWGTGAREAAPSPAARRHPSAPADALPPEVAAALASFAELARVRALMLLLAQDALRTALSLQLLHALADVLVGGSPPGEGGAAAGGGAALPVRRQGSRQQRQQHQRRNRAQQRVAALREWAFHASLRKGGGLGLGEPGEGAGGGDLPTFGRRKSGPAALDARGGDKWGGEEAGDDAFPDAIKSGGAESDREGNRESDRGDRVPPPPERGGAHASTSASGSTDSSPASSPCGISRARSRFLTGSFRFDERGDLVWSAGRGPARRASAPMARLGSSSSGGLGSEDDPRLESSEEEVSAKRGGSEDGHLASPGSISTSPPRPSPGEASFLPSAGAPSLTPEQVVRCMERLGAVVDLRLAGELASEWDAASRRWLVSWDAFAAAALEWSAGGREILVRGLFHRLDVAGAGVLTAEDLLAALGRHGVQAADVEALFAHADLDGDGALSMHEWLLFMAAHVEGVQEAARRERALVVAGG